MIKNKPGSKEKHILVVYYSRTGHTRAIANQIHETVGGDFFEIQSEKPYPGDYDAVTKKAKQEQESGYKPKLKTKIKNIRSYNVVFVGYPMWWGTFPMSVVTFLSEYDFSGKTIVPFCTHGGSYLGHSIEDITRLCPKSTIGDGLAVWGEDVKNAQKAVSEWLRKLGIKK